MPKAPSPGETIGKFKILRRLGEGATGPVFLATDMILNRQVALKFLTGLYELAANYFLREAQILAQLKHPNICEVHEVQTKDDYYFK